MNSSGNAKDFQDPNRFYLLSDNDSGNENSNEEDTNLHLTQKNIKPMKQDSGTISKPQSKSIKHTDFKENWDKISSILSSMKIPDVKYRLAAFNININKKKLVNQNYIKERLRNEYKTKATKIFRKIDYLKKIIEKQKESKNIFDYLIVIDFEATCEVSNPEDFPHEIIQFPAVLIDARTGENIAEFNSYCRPKLHPKLSSFCTKLTGITQETVDKAPDFPTVLQNFTNWMSSFELGSKYSFAIVTDGYCDMGKFLYSQCTISDIQYPQFAYRWIDIRILFYATFGVKWYKLPIPLELLGENFSGQHHNGLDDSKNIAKVLRRILLTGANLNWNEEIVLDKVKQEQVQLVHKYDLRTVTFLPTSRKNIISSSQVTPIEEISTITQKLSLSVSSS